MATPRILEKVQFQEQTLTADGGGGGAAKWRIVADCYAELRMVRGVEVLRSGRLEQATAGILKVRSNRVTRGVSPATHRVVIRGQDYQIRSNVDEDRKNQWLTLIVELGGGT